MTTYSLYSQLLSICWSLVLYWEPEDAPSHGDEECTWHGNLNNINDKVVLDGNYLRLFFTLFNIAILLLVKVCTESWKCSGNISFVFVDVYLGCYINSGVLKTQCSAHSHVLAIHHTISASVLNLYLLFTTHILFYLFNVCMIVVKIQGVKFHCEYVVIIKMVLIFCTTCRSTTRILNHYRILGILSSRIWLCVIW